MLATVLLIVAVVLFVLAALGVATQRINLVAAGLACWAASVLLSGLRL